MVASAITTLPMVRVKVVTLSFLSMMVVSYQIFYSSIKMPDGHKLQIENSGDLTISQQPDKVRILTNIWLLYLVAHSDKLTIKRAAQ